MALNADQVLNNRYRIIKLLGQGGFGEVYQAWDATLDGYCAVKRNLQPSPDARKQFQQEAKMLFKLRHPNLPRVQDYFTGAEDDQYLVMDFVEGEDLKDFIKRMGPSPVDQALAWLEQVCDALTYLHTCSPPLVHRDIKPANIIITPDDKAMLVDFGIAKTDPQLRTVSGARAWTPGFAPPEQYGQERTDARSDVYSLGATAYALLTGQAPPDAIDVAVGNKKPARPAHEVNPSVPLQVSKAISKAMQFNREQRTQSAQEFRLALRRRSKKTPEKKASLPEAMVIEDGKVETEIEIPSTIIEKPPLTVDQSPSDDGQVPVEQMVLDNQVSPEQFASSELQPFTEQPMVQKIDGTPPVEVEETIKEAIEEILPPSDPPNGRRGKKISRRKMISISGAVIAAGVLVVLGVWLFNNASTFLPKFTNSPSKTSIPTLSQKLVPTNTPVPTTSPIPPTATIPAPDKSLEYLNNVKVISNQTFDTPSTGDSGSGWWLDGGEIQNGVLEVIGNNWNAVGRDVQRTYKEGEGIIIDFTFDKGSVFELFFAHGDWETQRRFGTYISGGSAQANLWQGENLISPKPLPGNLVLKAGSKYSLMIAVLPGRELLGVIWDPSDSSKALVYHEKLGESWDNLAYTFTIGADKGTILFDNFKEIRFDSAK